jgi:hypothetical protein
MRAQEESDLLGAPAPSTPAPAAAEAPAAEAAASGPVSGVVGEVSRPGLRHAVEELPRRTP